jgi:hypothetical protein
MLTLESKEDDEKVLSDLHKKLAGLTDVKMDDEKTEIVIEKDTMSITVRDSIHLHCISRNYGPHLKYARVKHIRFRIITSENVYLSLICIDKDGNEKVIDVREANGECFTTSLGQEPDSEHHIGSVLPAAGNYTASITL